MSETREMYQVQTPLNPDANHVTLEQAQPDASLDLFQIERMLLPLLNEVRKQQGKKPVVVPRG